MLSEKLTTVSGGLHFSDRVRAVLPRSTAAPVRWIKARVLGRGLPRKKVFEQSVKDRSAGEAVSIVVPIHDAPLVTLRCLASLERYASKGEIILVDDGSRMAQTTDLIREFSERNGWRVVCNREALGHSASCAAGVALASRPYVCLLNSDTVVTPSCWRTIKEAFEIDPAIAVAGPSTSQSANEQTIYAAAYCRFDWNESQICGFAERLLTDSAEKVIVDLPWIAGCAFFIRRALWQELEGFDRNLPDYGNEMELCKRIGKAGYRIVWVRNSYIHHLGKQSYGQKLGSQEIKRRKMEHDQYILQKHS